MTMQFARVRDLDIRYELADYTDPWRAEEPQTFLLHSGYCRTLEFWRAWVPLLGNHYRILRFDPRGWGDTSKPPEGARIDIETMAGDAIGLLDCLGIRRVHWVGEATGGMIGFQAAMDHPARLQSLTVLNSLAAMLPETRGTYALDQEDQAAAIMKYGVEEWCLRTVRWRIDLDHAPPGVAEWMAREMGKTPARIAAAGFRNFSTTDLTARVPQIRTPTLLILGSKCTPHRHRKMQELRDRLPDARLVTIEGWEQGLHFLGPESMVREVRAFLDEMERDKK
jgi:pimeloyl-ACP methyl ester carboxylesterase